MRYRSLALTVTSLALVVAPVAAQPVIDYDIVYVRQSRNGDDSNTIWPEVAHPGRIEPGADLMLLHPDGTEEVLIAAGPGAVTDPFVSFDGGSVYYALFPDVTEPNLNYQRGDLSYSGADIYRMDLGTRQVTRLTFGEFTPNLGSGIWDETNPIDPEPGYNYLGYGILNLGPAPVAGGRIAFTSNRNAYWPPRAMGGPTMQLFVMDEDGSNVTPIAPMTIGSALHPTPLEDGRLLFSSLESQGNRDSRLWGIWSIYPDGRHWEPVVSAFNTPNAMHFMTQMGNGDLVVIDYYNLNNNGFGGMYRLPVAPPPGTPRFHSPIRDENPPLDATAEQGFSWPARMSFSPWGIYSLSPFTHPYDQAAPIGTDGQTRVGKFTQPSAAPGGDLLVVWTPGPANDLNRPTPVPYYDAGLYLVPGGAIVDSPDQLVTLKNDPEYNEAWPRAVVRWSDVHGVEEPAELPWLPNDGTLSPELPAGTPYGLVGTSSVYKRESFPGDVVPWSDTFDGLDAFNTLENGQSPNWGTQGADAGKYDDSEIWAIRILALEPNTHRSYGPGEGTQFYSHANERIRILGEIPLRKWGPDGEPILDPEGNPDTSFLARIPADTPFTFQTIDQNGVILNMAQTWHQVRPGEMRADCGGCHAHSQLPLDFESTAAAAPGYRVPDLTRFTPLLTRDAAGEPAVRVVRRPLVDVEFYRDIRPLLERSCVSCHTEQDPEPPGNLVLDDHTLYDQLYTYDDLPGDYVRLCGDWDADWGYPPVIGSLGWRQTNASRYVRRFQSRRSLLIWKIFGARLDGWTNDDHPTERVPGDPDTLPPGADVNEADLDFTGTIMPPPGGAPPLSENEKMIFARWVDLGCPINYDTSDHADLGWHLDDLRPTLTVSLPRPGESSEPVDLFRIGVADAHSGIDPASLSVTASLAVEGRSPGSELIDLMVVMGEGILGLPLSRPLDPVGSAHLFVEVADRQGNVTRVDREFSIVAPAER